MEREKKYRNVRNGLFIGTIAFFLLGCGKTPQVGIGDCITPRKASGAELYRAFPDGGGELTNTFHGRPNPIGRIETEAQCAVTGTGTNGKRIVYRVFCPDGEDNDGNLLYSEAQVAGDDITKCIFDCESSPRYTGTVPSFNCQP